MEKARNCFEYKLSGDWRVIGEKKGESYCGSYWFGGRKDCFGRAMICNEILYFDLMYIFFRGKALNKNLEIGLISVNIINHKEIIDLYIYIRFECT